MKKEILEIIKLISLDNEYPSKNLNNLNNNARIFSEIYEYDLKLLFTNNFVEQFSMIPNQPKSSNVVHLFLFLPRMGVKPETSISNLSHNNLDLLFYRN